MQFQRGICQSSVLINCRVCGKERWFAPFLGSAQQYEPWLRRIRITPIFCHYACKFSLLVYYQYQQWSMSLQAHDPDISWAQHIPNHNLRKLILRGNIGNILPNQDIESGIQHSPEATAKHFWASLPHLIELEINRSSWTKKTCGWVFQLQPKVREVVHDCA